jgi:nucleoside-diphosphate-sugar epimerase
MLEDIDRDRIVLVTGAGGFIGGHIVATLRQHGFPTVRGVDIKPLADWHRVEPGAENLRMDLRDAGNCRRAVEGCGTVLNFAADMGGMGFIEAHKADCMLSVLINTQLLVAAREARVGRYLYASSACVYAANKQTSVDVTPLREQDAYPAMPEDGYGWEKLFGERMCRHFREDFGLETRVVRYHNVYGPHGTFDGERAKAPAAICRKIAEAKRSCRGWIEIWGDGEQRRSFMYIDDCLHGTLLVLGGGYAEPINLGSEETVSINELVGIVERIAGVRLERRYNLEAPQGVRGRSSDNSLIRATFGWAPSIALEFGLERTYRWIHDQIKAS